MKDRKRKDRIRRARSVRARFRHSGLYLSHVGGATTDTVETVKRRTHDLVIAKAEADGVERCGPVRWLIFEGAVEALEAIESTPDLFGGDPELVEFFGRYPEGLLVAAVVPCLRPREK